MIDDLRQALRRLRGSPGFTLAALLTLALAVGANTAILGVADAVLFRPLPYDEPGRIFVLRTLDPRTGEIASALPYAYVSAILDHHDGVETIGLRGQTTMTTHAGSGGADWMESFAVSASYLAALGVRPHRGRPFGPDDEPAGWQRAMLSYECWIQRFGGDGSIVGRTVRLGSENREIVGVLPQGFLFPAMAQRHLYSLTGRPDFVTAAAPPAEGVESAEGWGLAPSGTAFEPVVRLRQGVTRAQAQTRLDALAAGVSAERGLPAEQAPVLQAPRAVLFPTGQPVLLLLLGAAVLVLALGSANLAQMLVARTRMREREIGVRVALGASRLRVIRPMLLEGIVLALTGSALALAVTSLTFGALERQVPRSVYGIAAIGVDARVAGFTLGLALLSAFAFAVVPAWRAARMDVQPLLRRPSATRGATAARPLVALQAALAIVLVCGAAMAARSLASVLRLPLGFDPGNVVLLHVSPATPDDDEWSRFFTEAVETLARHPDVLTAGAGRAVPLVLPGGSDSVQNESGSSLASVVHMLPGYFETTGMRLTRGRGMTWDDARGDVGVAVVSESAAAALWPGADPLTRTLTTASGRTLQIVGVAADVVMSLERAMPPPVYATPAARMGNMSLFARVRSRDAATLARVRGAVAAMAPDAPVTAGWWSERIDAITPFRQPRFQTLMLGGFATLALGLTALGIFAAVAFVVASRTRELGVRMALGATPPSLVRLVVFQALVPVVGGVLLGALGVFWLRQLVDAHLTGLDTRDPAALGAAIVTVLTAALLAAWLPARQASRVDPAVVLRAE